MIKAPESTPHGLVGPGAFCVEGKVNDIEEDPEKVVETAPDYIDVSGSGGRVEVRCHHCGVYLSMPDQVQASWAVDLLADFISVHRGCEE